MRLNDAVIGIALILFALAMIAYTRTFPEMPGQHYGPALFPVLIGIGFIITGVILIVSGLRRRRASRCSAAANGYAPAACDQLRPVGGLLLYILAPAGWASS